MTKIGKNYRAAVVGCGQIGALFEAEPKREKPASHAGAVLANDRTELVALVDTNAKNLAAARKLFPRASAYASLSACLKQERPNIVVIATPPQARLSVLKECVRAGVRIVVCEKPLAANAKEAKQMAALVAKSGITFVLNYQRRFSPLFAQVRADLQKGKIGTLQQATCYYSNGLYSNGGHIIDALSYLLNDTIVSVIGIEHTENKTHSAGDVNVDALLTTRKGTKIVLQSFDQKKYGIHDIRLYGTKGSIVLTEYGTERIDTPARPSRFVGVLQLDASQSRATRAATSATKDALAHAIERYEKHRAPESSAASGRATLQVLDAIAKSATQGGKKITIQ